jgi:3-hydroxyisobutyrate dehydrogenase
MLMKDGDSELGFIGLGLMGWPIAERLLKAGHAVTVWNRSQEKVARALDAGARAGATPADVTRSADIVFVCVTDDRSVESVVFGAGGIAETATGDKILVDCSTIKPAASRQFAQRLREETGMAWVDAPVTGGVVGAKAGRLVVLAGGEEAEIARIRPIMAAMSQSLVHMGPQGAGLVTKLCNQVINSCTKVVLSEMLQLAAAGGIDGARLPEALRGGSADSSQLQREVPRMMQRDFDHPHGTLGTMMKDLDIIREFTRETGTAMPVTGLVTELCRLHVARGNADRDSISIYETIEGQRKPGA